MNQLQSHHRSLEDATAVIIALKSRRFVIVRKDEPKPLYPEPICKRIRDLRAGDTIHYHGKRDTVCGIDAY